MPFVINRISALFSRYAARHLRLEMPQSRLPKNGAVHVHALVLENNYLKIEGAGATGAVSVVLAGIRRTTSATPPAPFMLILPYGPGPGRMLVQGADGEVTLPLPEFSSRRLWVARARLWPGFAVALLRAAPAAVAWFRRQDPAARIRVRDTLGLEPLVHAHRLEEDLLAAKGAAPCPALPDNPSGAPLLTVIMPVYNAFEVLGEALDRLHRHTDLPWRLILIDDCSTDARIRPLLHDWAARMQADNVQVDLVANTQNLGFIGTVNRGFERALEYLEGTAPDTGAPIVLLNTDALVPAGWAGRLIAPILAERDVASVTPMSNNAELLTIPHISCPHDLEPGMIDRIDHVAQRICGTGSGGADMPTGVGFCMAVSAHYLRQVGLFDPAFGPGYGEEVDWCQKAIRAGGRHVAQPGLFVEHRGGTSFGSQEKQRLLHKNGALLAKRYPLFTQQVQNFISEDPLFTPRLVLGLALAAAEAQAKASGPVPVYLGHSMGGGAEIDLKRRMAADVEMHGAVLLLRVGTGLRWLIELHTRQGTLCGATADDGFLTRLVALLPARRVIYSCGVGAPNPVELPDLLLTLGDAENGGFEVLFHDYLPLSPSYTLLGRDGYYHGVPMPEAAGKGQGAPAHSTRHADGSPVDLATWRAAWGRLMARADRLEVFSESSRALVAAAFPEQAAKIVLAPHKLPQPVPKIAPPRGGPGPVIGILGNIGHHKGAGELVRLSRKLARRGRKGQGRQAKLVVIGNLDPAYRLPPPAVIHGDYTVTDIPALVARYKISCWLIPSIWPETFSFTTHEALATGLPVFAFDIGAQGDLVARAQRQGAVIALHDGRPDLDQLLDLVAQINRGKPFS